MNPLELNNYKNMGAYYLGDLSNNQVVKKLQELYNQDLPIKGYHQSDIVEICLGIFMSKGSR